MAANLSLGNGIELRHSRKELLGNLIGPLVFFALAYLVWRYPGWLWRPWLSYTGCVLLILAAIAMIWSAFDMKGTRIAANENGVEVKGTADARKFSWNDIASLQRETVTRRVRHLHAIRHNTSADYWYSTEEESHTFTLFDHSGKALLAIDEDEPMEPVEDWLKLRAYIPQRTGLPVTQVTRESKLGDRQAI